MGYVKCAGYVWDMCGVRYANNLLKNPATKRLSGKKRSCCDGRGSQQERGKTKKNAQVQRQDVKSGWWESASNLTYLGLLEAQPVLKQEDHEWI